MNDNNIVKAGSPLLKKVAAKIESFNTPELHDLIEKLYIEMEKYQGVGLSAPQIGVSKSVLVYGFDVNLRYPGEGPVPKTTLINPSIIYFSDEKEEGAEGCLSLPRVRGLVPRSITIKYTAYTPDGIFFEKEARGFEARIIQHEVDHLNGLLFPMRMSDISTLFISEN